MILFHGGTDSVSKPVVLTGDQGRDFGFAFYTTDIREQAERWALRRARYHRKGAGAFEVPPQLRGAECVNTN